MKRARCYQGNTSITEQRVSEELTHYSSCVPMSAQMSGWEESEEASGPPGRSSPGHGDALNRAITASLPVG